MWMMGGLVRAVSVAAFVAAAGITVAAPAGARPAPAIGIVVQTGNRAAGAPIANLLGNGATTRFKPGRLKAHEYANDSECLGGGVSLTIVNGTRHTVDLTLFGNGFDDLAAHSSLPFCAYGSSPTTLQFGIAGSTHVLNVKLNAKY
jgi:hypothetical protein